METVEEFWRLVLEVWNSGIGGVNIGRILGAILILAVFFLLRGLFTRFVVGRLGALAQRTTNRLDDNMVASLEPPIRLLPVVVGAATILQIWGIQVGPIIAGAGLFGVAVALGAQDLFKNLIAGILIIGEKRFRVGDWIRVEGTVESIGFRSTIVRRFDKAPVLVPNAKLADTAVINFSGMTHRRIYPTIGVEYHTTIDQLRQIRDEIERYVVDSPDFASPEEVSTFVRIDRFGDSSIDIMLYCFTRTTNWGEWLKIKEALALRIKEIVETAGTGFAFPSRSLYVEQIPSERPEVFIPPGSNAARETVRAGGAD